MTYNILDFGAKNNGVFNNQEAIQKAIDTCHNNGGGRVIVPAGGMFKTGSIILKSYVELHLELGATLKASDNLADYLPLANNGQVVAHASGLPSFLNSDYAGQPFHAFIYSKDSRNVVISGYGTIDANEAIFYGHDSGYHIEGTYYPRIPLMLLEKTDQLTIKDVSLINCAFWSVHLVGCQDVLIDGIRLINNLKMANSDGIDPDHCKNVRISNCYIECGDDCIVLKNTKDYQHYGACENIAISNCTLVSTSAAIKIGTESESDFRNIVVNNCVISRSNRGISIQLRDKGNVENLIFSNIIIETRRFSNEWWGRAEPIAITALDRKEGMPCGKIKNIIFNNITCEAENGIFIKGNERSSIENIKFNNINLTMRRASKWDITGYDTRPGYNQAEIETKLSAIYCENANNVKLSDFTVNVADDFKDFYKEELSSLNSNVEVNP